jgi:hypothetical protein
MPVQAISCTLAGETVAGAVAVEVLRVEDVIAGFCEAGEELDDCLGRGCVGHEAAAVLIDGTGGLAVARPDRSQRE